MLPVEYGKLLRVDLNSPGQLSPAQPLWGNPVRPHLRTIPDPQLWAKYGVTTLRDIMPDGYTLKLFPIVSEVWFTRQDAI